jgi:ribosome-associated protein
MQKETLTRVANAKACAQLAVQGIQDKKGIDIVSLDLQEVDGADIAYMIICQATSDTHAGGIARSVEEIIYNKTGEKPWHTEGMEKGEWILLDYVDVVVHIFLKEKREFYNLEDLWGDAKFTHHSSE